MLFCTVVYFLPFGTEVGDSEARLRDNGTLGPYNLSVPIVFYLQREYQLYVSRV